ncbi:MAG TPA: hypothetical protein VGC55_18170 [Dokdonella sp.]
MTDLADHAPDTERAADGRSRIPAIVARQCLSLRVRSGLERIPARIRAQQRLDVRADARVRAQFAQAFAAARARQTDDGIEQVADFPEALRVHRYDAPTLLR